MEDNDYKYNSRLRNPDEIFTPKKIVDFMINQPEIIEKVNDIHSTFLEPSAGDGAFLIELLRRKMHVSASISLSPYEYGEKCLMSLSSLYGIELLNDNVKMLVMNMFSEFSNNYKNVILTKFNSKYFSKRVLDSAMVIIKANMIQGNTLKGTTTDDNPIIFSEWKSDFGNEHIVHRKEYTFESIINGSGSTGTVNNYTEEIDLFADTNDFDDYDNSYNGRQYSPVKWVDIYRQDVF